MIAAILLVTFYLCYTWYILPGLRVFKHVLRGLSHARVEIRAPRESAPNFLNA